MAALTQLPFFMPKPSRTAEECILEAKKYASRSEFFKGCQSVYVFLNRRGLLDEACSHMELSPRYSYVKWTKEAVLEEAKNYNSRSEFRRCNQGAYGFALANKLLTAACSHMTGGNGFWNIFELMAVAVKYKHQPDFIRSEPQAYNYANKNKLVDIACRHMTRHVITWSKDLVIAEAAKYDQRGLFQAAASGAYKHADKYGYLDEACAHMPPPEYGFSKEKQATLYHIRFTTASGLTLYKLGITNRDVNKRIIGMGIPEGMKIEILDQIIFDAGRDARIAEKRLHRRYADQKYRGDSVLKNGNTELFCVPLIEQ